MKTIVGNVTGTHISMPRAKRQTKRNIENQCPSCNCHIKYIQRARKHSAKPIVCNSCSIALISFYDEDTDDFLISKAGPKLEQFKCPSCKEVISGEIDTRPHKKAKVMCNNVIKT